MLVRLPLDDLDVFVFDQFACYLFKSSPYRWMWRYDLIGPENSNLQLLVPARFKVEVLIAPSQRNEIRVLKPWLVVKHSLHEEFEAL